MGREIYGAKLPRRRLGRSGITTHGLTLGGHPLGLREVTDEEAVETSHYALEQGLTHFDTSAGYGECERRLGVALEGVPRESITISTKAGSHPQRRGDYSWDGTMWSVENSLKLLKTDYLDILLVHDPGIHSSDGMKSVFAKRGMLEALEHLKDQRVIGAIGLGEKRHHLHKQAIESGRFDVILSFNDYHPLNTCAANWLFPLAKENDVGVLLGSAMAHGLLTGKGIGKASQRILEHLSEAQLSSIQRFHKWRHKRDIPMAAIIFQFCLRQPLIDCVLTGVKRRSELQENLEAATMPLPDLIWDELDELDLMDWMEKDKAKETKLSLFWGQALEEID
jgi:aryl-alcohol dehydrogenase-like predicted oxidoreductase